MKKTLYLILFSLIAVPAFAQQYFHRSYPEPVSDFTTNVQMQSLADGNVCFTSSFADSAFLIERIDASNGAVIRRRSFNGLGAGNKDTVGFADYSRFFATRDSGMAVVFTHYNMTLPPGPADSSDITVIKLDKNLEIQWALTNRYATADTSGFYISAITSDNADNTILSYSLGSLYGLCKIAPSGAILATKHTATSFADNLFAIGANHYLGIAMEPDFFNDITAYKACVLDNQLNVLSSQAAVTSGLFDIFSYSQNGPPVYNQRRVSNIVAQYIPVTAQSYQVLSNCYFQADTSGTLEQLYMFPAQVSLSSVSAGADNRVYLTGFYQNNKLVAALDTAANTVFAKALSAQDLLPVGLARTGGNDLLLACFTGTPQSTAATNNLIRFKNDGTWFCPTATGISLPLIAGSSFTPLTLPAPVFSNASAPLHAVQIDTIATAPILSQVLCIGTGIDEYGQRTIQSNVSYTGNYTALVTLPENVREGTLAITDMNGRRICLQDVHGNRATIQLPEVPAGIYAWQLLYNINQRDAGKFLVP